MRPKDAVPILQGQTPSGTEKPHSGPGEFSSNCTPTRSMRDFAVDLFDRYTRRSALGALGSVWLAGCAPLTDIKVTVRVEQLPERLRPLLPEVRLTQPGADESKCTELIAGTQNATHRTAPNSLVNGGLAPYSCQPAPKLPGTPLRS